MVNGKTGSYGRLRTRAARLAGALVALAVLAAVAGAAAAPGAAPARKSQRPNVVVISTDDQTVESLRVMANVNRLLAAQGTTFDNSFASFPLCCPWRATFLTGQYSHNNGVVGNHLSNGLANLDERNTLPVWLRASGYATAFVGKYLNGYGVRDPRLVPPGWDEWYAGVTMGYFNYTMNRNGKLLRYGSTPGSYQTDVYTKTALNVVRRRAPDDRPFFLWLSYFAPHHGDPVEPSDVGSLKSAVPAPRHAGRFATEPLPQTPSFGEADVTDKPAALQRRAVPSPEVVEALTSTYRQRLESLLAVDEGVAQLVAALRAAGELERTLLVFTSDNGFLEGQHRIVNAKEFVYEPSVRVPLVVRGPGVRHGVRVQQPVSNVDLAPTIVELAQARPRRVLDGVSLVPLLRDPGLEWGRDVLLERGPGTAASTGTRLYTAIRTPRFKYVENLSGERELYDLAADPDELQSLHADPAFGAMQALLAQRLAALRDCAGTACNTGPALQLEAPDEGGCVRRVRVAGGDEPQVAYVHFTANGRFLAAAEAAPFEHVFVPGSTPPDARVRVLAVLHDGRRLTLDAAVRVCAQ